MNLNQLTVAKWGSRAYLVGVGVVLGYGLNQGDPFAGYDHTAVFVAFNPFFVGAALALNGIGKSMAAQSANTANATLDDNQVDLDDENSDFLDDEMAMDNIDESYDDSDYALYDTYGTL